MYATRFNLVRAYLQAGRTVEALKLARELSAQNKDDVQLHFTLGMLLAAEKQYSAGQLELEKASALQPETFEILFNLGQTYLRSGNYAKAEVVLNRALKLKPDSAATLALLAQVYSGQNRPVDALDFLARAHKLAPAGPGHHSPSGSAQHGAELFRRRDPSAGIGLENRSASAPIFTPLWAKAIS